MLYYSYWNEAKQGGMMGLITIKKIAMWRPSEILQAELDAKYRADLPLLPPEILDKIRENDLQRRKRYSRQRRCFGQSVCRFLMQEIDELIRNLDDEEINKNAILHLGIGEGDDLRYVRKILLRHMNVIFIDASEVVCLKAQNKLNRMASLYKKEKEASRLEILLGDIGLIDASFDAWLPGEQNELPLNPGRTLIVYASRIFQLLDREKLEHSLRSFGKVLQNRNRRILIVHPLPEDNRGVRWGKTTMYPLRDIRSLIQQGAIVRGIRTKILGKIQHYNRTYSVISFRSQR